MRMREPGPGRCTVPYYSNSTTGVRDTPCGRRVIEGTDHCGLHTTPRGRRVAKDQPPMRERYIAELEAENVRLRSELETARSALESAKNVELMLLDQLRGRDGDKYAKLAQRLHDSITQPTLPPCPRCGGPMIMATEGAYRGFTACEAFCDQFGPAASTPASPKAATESQPEQET